MKKLAIITTHPIQYNAPFFAKLSQNGKFKVKVFYTWGQTANQQVFDPGFGNSFKWDLPLLQGYDFEFLENISKNPGSSHFKGIINPDIIAKLSGWSPDAILIYGWCFQSHLIVMRHFSGKVPIWFRGDSTLLDENPGFSLKKFIRRIVLSWVYSYVDLSFYVGKDNKEYFLAHGMKESQLVYAPHAIDNARFSSWENHQQESLEKIKQNLGIQLSDLVFLFSGKLELKKSPELLLDAFLSVGLSHVHLIYVGDGELMKRLKNKAAGIRNVHFLGFQNQNQMPLFYRLCDVFVLPSRGPGETWGLALNEAMACGKPLIASSFCGAAKELIEIGKNGWILVGQNPDELNQLIHNAIKLGKASLMNMGSSALKKVEFFTYNHFQNALNEALRN